MFLLRFQRPAILRVAVPPPSPMPPPEQPMTASGKKLGYLHLPEWWPTGKFPRRPPGTPTPSRLKSWRKSYLSHLYREYGLEALREAQRAAKEM